MNIQWHGTGDTWSSSSTTSAYLYYGTAASDDFDVVTQSTPLPEPKPETPLAWLDRRVNEMRVAL